MKSILCAYGTIVHAFVHRIMAKLARKSKSMSTCLIVFICFIHNNNFYEQNFNDNSMTECDIKVTYKCADKYKRVVFLFLDTSTGRLNVQLHKSDSCYCLPRTTHETGVYSVPSRCRPSVSNWSWIAVLLPSTPRGLTIGKLRMAELVRWPGWTAEKWTAFTPIHIIL